MEQRILVIDTDGGIDDALALFIILRAHKDPKIPWRVAAITCVNGNTELDNVCLNMTRLLEVAGTPEIPIFRGAGKNILNQRMPKRASPIHGTDGFGDADFPKIIPKLEKEHAALALIRLAHEFEGELTVVAIGPLTNVALAINLDSTFDKSIKELCIMGGHIGGVVDEQPFAEFNFWYDPEAAQVVLGCQFHKPILLVPWEACKIEAKFDIEWRLETLAKLNTTESNFLDKIEEKTLERNAKSQGGWVSCDPLLPSVMLNSMVTRKTECYRISVELNANETRGRLIVLPKLSGKPENVIAVTKINMDHYKNVILWGLYGNCVWAPYADF